MEHFWGCRYNLAIIHPWKLHMLRPSTEAISFSLLPATSVEKTRFAFWISSSTTGCCNSKMFKVFKRKAKITGVEPPADVRDAFTTYSDGGSLMTSNQLNRFLMEHQGEAALSVADSDRLVKQFIDEREDERPTLNDDVLGLCLDDFFDFLFSTDLNGPLDEHKVYHDMTAPLSHYFIYTGHNSYLTGNQLSSDCSEAPIIRALNNGVRVIELDMWPNSAKNDILILHGRTLTSPVRLIKCLTSIKEHAFVKSPYPVIITLEDHLMPELQARVAELVTETFGDMLSYPEVDCLTEFPSPESLRHRIIISTKPPKDQFRKAKGSKDNSSGKKDLSDEEEQALLDDIDWADEGDWVEEEDSDRRQGEITGPHYRRLITIHAGKPKGCLKEALKFGEDKVKRLSLSEQELERVVESHGAHVVRFTRKNILRIYPKGTRITSSNYNPLVGWMHGAQMVAFNMQGYGKFLWIMQGMFRANGGCGYVKKPDFLINGSHDELFDPKSSLTTVKKTLKVKVYMSDGWNLDFKLNHFDTFSPPDFYAKLYMSGVPSDVSKRKTRTIGDNWFPVWDEEFSFPLTVPELALLLILVKDHDPSEKDDFGGQTCLPISEVKTGIRAVPLYDKKGVKYPSVKILMRFQFL